MSLTCNAEATTARTAGSRWLELLTRAGFIGYGIVHVLFGWLALRIAFGNPAGDGDQSGALRTLVAQPMGRFLVVAIAVGMLAMAVWQAVEAAVGHRAERGNDRLKERIFSAARTVIYLWLAWTAYQVFANANSDSAAQQEEITARMMQSTGGRWVVGLAGLVLAAIGVGMVVYGVRKKFMKRLRTGQMSPRSTRFARRLGMVGYAARGGAFALTGLLVVLAAVNYDPEKARGLDAALRTLRDQSFGPALLALIASGIAAFGLYCFLQARHRKL